MFVNFSEETKHLIKQSIKEKEELKHPYVGSEHLFLSVLKDSRLKEIFKKNKLTYEGFKEKLISLVGKGSKNSDFTLYTPLFKRVLRNSVIEAREQNSKNVSPEIVIISILNEEDGIAYGILKSMKINIDKLYFDIKTRRNIRQNKKRKLMIEERGIDLIKLAKENKIDPVIGRDKEILKTIEILLRRKKNNPILLGPAGVGKTAIVEGIANIMASDNCPIYLKNKRLIAFNIYELVSGTKYRGEFEEKMKVLIKELEENEDIILFIDEIHTIVGAGGAEGAIDASNIFKPALARGNIRIIGATTLNEYKKYIEPDAALSRRFQSVIINEPDIPDVINILKKIRPLYEKYHNVKISNELLEDIVNLSNKYLSSRFEPDRSIDILDEVCSKVSITETKSDKKKKVISKKINDIMVIKNKALIDNNFKEAYDLTKEENKLKEELKTINDDNKIVSKKDIYDVIKNKGNFSVFSEGENKEKLYEKIKKDLKKQIFGQDENIDKLVRNIQKKDILRKKGCCSILLVGPKKSGKTFFAECYAKSLSNEKNIIRIDGLEYYDYHTISKLIGTTAGYLGYDNKNNVFEKLKVSPNSVLIIDNFDEACNEFKNIFKRILEYNYIEDASGTRIDFSNSTIIFINETNNCVSNVGFNNNLTNKEDDDNKLNNVSITLQMKKLDEASLYKVIKNKIVNVIKKYPNIYIEYDKRILRDIYCKIKENDLSCIDNLIENRIEEKIVDAIIDNKRKVNIKADEESIV